jgi:hypothetical protein
VNWTGVVVAGLVLFTLAALSSLRLRRRRRTSKTTSSLELFAAEIGDRVPISIVRYAAETEAIAQPSDPESYGRLVRRLLSIFEEYQDARANRLAGQQSQLEIERLRMELRNLKELLDNRPTSSQVVVIILTTLAGLAGIAGLVVAVVRLVVGT